MINAIFQSCARMAGDRRRIVRLCSVPVAVVLLQVLIVRIASAQFTGAYITTVVPAQIDTTSCNGGVLNPMGLAIGTGPYAGSLYVADEETSSDTICQVTPSGSVSIFQSTSGHLHNPTGLAFDGAGNLFIADSSSFRVARVDGTSGAITTYAGLGASLPTNSGAAPASIYFPQAPNDLKFDGSGNLWIVTTNQIYEITGMSTGTPLLSLIAGDGTVYSGTPICTTTSTSAASAEFSLLTGLAIDSAGDLYVGDSICQSILELSAGAGTVTPYVTFSGDSKPTGTIAIDGSNNLYVGDSFAQVVWEVSGPSTKYVIAGNVGVTGYVGTTTIPGVATSADLYQPWGVVLDGTGDLFISNHGTSTVLELVNPNPAQSLACDTAGTICTVAGNVHQAGMSGSWCGDDGLAAYGACLNQPLGLYLDSASPQNIYLADSSNGRVREFTVGGSISTFAGGGSGLYGNGDGGPPAAAWLNDPMAVTEDSSGNIAILDCEIACAGAGVDVDTISRTRIVSASTGYISTLSHLFCYSPGGCEYDEPPASTDITFGTNGNSSVGLTGLGLYISAWGEGSVAFESSDESTYTSYLSAPSWSSNSPISVALDGAGNLYFSNGDLYDQDYSGYVPFRGLSGSDYVIQEIDAAGDPPYKIAGTGTAGPCVDGPSSTTCIKPGSLAVDGSGNVFFVDQSNCTVRVLSAADNNIYTVAGTGTCGYSGDGGAATSAQLNNPGGIKLDALGNLYISDTGNNLVREVTQPLGRTIIHPCVPRIGHPCH